MGPLAGDVERRQDVIGREGIIGRYCDLVAGMGQGQPIPRIFDRDCPARYFSRTVLH